MEDSEFISCLLRFARCYGNWAAIGNEKTDFSVAHSIDMFFYFLKFYILLLIVSLALSLILSLMKGLMNGLKKESVVYISKKKILSSVNKTGKYVAVAVVGSTYVFQYLKVHNFEWFMCLNEALETMLGECYPARPLMGNDIACMLLFSSVGLVMLEILHACSKVLFRDTQKIDN